VFNIQYYGILPVTEARAELLQGDWYVQLHSAEYLNGVIRGYVVPVPEPGAGTLGAIAIAIVGFSKVVRRRHGTLPLATERSNG
jgi:hypothetical protein